MEQERTIRDWWLEWWEKHPERVKIRDAKYPEIDREYVVEYPCDYGYVDPRKIWDKTYYRREKQLNCYVHVPFCIRLCKFCIYNRYLYDPKLVNTYIKALKKEIEAYSKIEHVQDSLISTVYFGGGTPTVLTLEQFSGVFEHIKNCLNISEKAEITVEAHPKTVTATKLCGLQTIGINRVSFGVQTFNRKILEGSHLFYHKAKDSLYAIKMAKESGFDNIAIDLMYRLPAQTLEDWKQDLLQATELDLSSLSIYSLVLPPSLDISQPNDELDVKMYQFAVDHFATHRYQQYTISDFSIPGKECAYLRNIFQAPQQEFLGFGAGAFSFIHGHVLLNIHSLKDYIAMIRLNRLPVLMGKELSIEEEVSRYVILGVKCLSVNARKFKEIFGVEINNIFGDVLDRLESLGLVTIGNTFIKLTEKGKIYVDNISKMFYTENNIGKRQSIGTLLQNVHLPQKF